jgi:hypothetical protein
MIEAHLVGSKEKTMQISQKRKNEQQDNLLEELLREKAAVLSRAGMAVDDVIGQLMRVDREIELKISLLKAFSGNEHVSEVLRKKQSIHEEINLNIDQFNTIRQKALTQYYYLIVTREALGLRRHEMIHKIYRIPEKKGRIKAV